MHSLTTLLPYSNRTIKTLEEETQFTDVMADLVQTHNNTIPVLARGFLECRKYIAPETVTKFLDEHLRARIGTRLIAEQHIALHLSSLPHSPPDASPSNPSSSTTKPESRTKEEDTHIGVIDTSLSPAAVVRTCESFVGELCELRYGVRPSVIINGNVDARIAYVPTHLEYILTELLKNAFRATVENGMEREAVEVTIAASAPMRKVGDVVEGEKEGLRRGGERSGEAGNKESGGGRGSGGAGSDITIRIRDRGGGISPAVLPNVWAYSFTTFNEDEASSRSSNLPVTSTNTPPLSASTSTTSFPASPITSFPPSPTTPSPSRHRDSLSDRSLNALNLLAQTGSSSTSPLAGLGYGLPLGRAYAEHFGGGIEMESLWGWGTDVWVRVRGLEGDGF